MTEVGRAVLESWLNSPTLMVKELFGATPDRWQEEVLESFPRNPRIAMKACAGPGKSCVMSWCAWNFMLTRPGCKIGVASISKDNLQSGLWSELALWRRKSPLLMSQFESVAGEFYQRQNRDTWRMEARTWAKDADPTQIGNALRGLHAPYVMWVLDETGGYPDAMMPVAENIFSGNPVEAHILIAGNPTHLTGPLYRACTTARDIWKVITITGDPDDPMRSPRIPIEHARAQIKQYGRDNPWVQVNILGQFPDSAINTLLSMADIEASLARKYQQHDVDNHPRILGVDVAREGLDKSVIFPRQGLVAFTPKIMRNVNSIQGAGQVARTWTDWDVDAVFVDNTGGFGAGWIDQLSLLNRHAIPVGFAEKAQDRRYFNRRAEMHFRMAEWIKKGGAIPDIPELVRGLVETTYTFKGDALLLEPKEQIKVRLGYSPDEVDGLALTFADDVAPRFRGPQMPFRSQRQENYDPFKAYM